VSSEDEDGDFAFSVGEEGLESEFIQSCARKVKNKRGSEEDRLKGLKERTGSMPK
jgi:hypothetical protein